MGLFDGRGPGSEGSTAAVAALLDLPVVLVVEASRQAGSLAALVRGFRDHGPPRVQLAGVVLNRVGSERHRALLAEALTTIAVPLLGVLPSHPGLSLPSRHLGLLPPGELADLPQRQALWASLAEQHLDLDRLWPLLAPPPPPAAAVDPIRWCLGLATPAGEGPAAAGESPAAAGIATPAQPHPAGSAPLPIAIASDAAFHFRYPEASELLTAVGLQPQPWSPLADEPLPAGCCALVLPGGYPELHASRLAGCRRSLAALVRAAAAGIPIVAECGGLLLLGRQLHDQDDRPWPMAALLPFSARRGALSLGYRQAVVAADGLLVRHQERLIGHEFHRWQLIDPDADADAALHPPGGQSPAALAPPDVDPQRSEPPLMANRSPLWQLEGWGCPGRAEGWTSGRLHATWLHLHWAGCPAIPWRLAAAAAAVGSVAPSGASSNPPRPAPAPPRNAGG